MTGGAGRSGVWPGVVADICGVDVKVVMLDELTAYGAAIAAAAACGFDTIGNIADIAETIVYRPQRADEYKLWYEKFQKKLFE
jgi:sugar (pentulose or hexulose) kinase